MTLAPERLQAPHEDIDGVMKASLDYVEGFTRGDANRHAEAYHPEALKRRYTNSEVSGIDILETISPQGMVDYAATGLSVVEDIEYEVVVDGIVRDIASVRLYSTKWVDFLHIVKARGQWRILHASWCYQPGMDPTD
jgi:Putative lumazine-binding